MRMLLLGIGFVTCYIVVNSNPMITAIALLVYALLIVLSRATYVPLGHETERGFVHDVA
jgi:hypothetical protein